MTTAATPTPDNNNQRIKALAEDIAGLIRDNRPNAAIKKFRAELKDDQYAILMDRDARVLREAAWYGHADAITAMLSELSPDQRVTAITAATKHGDTPMHGAALAGRVNAITAMLAELSAEQHLTAITVQDEDKNTPLYVAALDGYSDVITTMLAGLNTAQCTNALFNEQHGAAIKLAHEYADDPENIEEALNTLIEGIAALELSKNDKKGLITGILEEVEKINRHAEIPSAVLKYMGFPKTVGDFLQSSFAQAATTTTAVPANGNDHTSEATIGNADVHKCKMRRIRYGCEPMS